MDRPTHSGRSGISLRRCLVAGALLLACGWIGWQLANHLSLEKLSASEQQLRSFVHDRPGPAYLAAFAGSVVITTLAIPIGGGLALAAGWVFGFWPALVLFSFSTTCGSTLAMLSSRYVLRDLVQRRYGTHLERVNRAVAVDGAWYLLAMRLMPLMPYSVVNLLMGLSPISVWTFWWASQVGKLPLAALLIYAGSNLPDLQTCAESGISGVITPPIMLSLSVLAVFPIVIKKCLGWATRQTPEAIADGASLAPMSPKT